ncbi:hypothetical protein AAKU64_003081 [Undibacterium sp. GrIS 1.8]|uniref:DUF4265 domain-containing protein n=1 Tax=unclassified Undibacterium TaxID=2630295 RepID=UPI003398574C
MEDKEKILIHVYAGESNNLPVFEELPAYNLGGNIYELLSSPGLALNLAKSDVVEIVDTKQPVKVLKRGGNFCIQIYSDNISDQDLSHLEKDVAHVLSGTVDGVYMGNLSLTVPSSAGIENINVFFDSFTKKTGVQWYFGNVYENFEDIQDETLLNWWL